LKQDDIPVFLLLEHMQEVICRALGMTTVKVPRPFLSLTCKGFLLERGYKILMHWGLTFLSVTFLGSSRLSRSTCLQIPVHMCWQKTCAYAVNLMQLRCLRFAVHALSIAVHHLY